MEQPCLSIREDLYLVFQPIIRLKAKGRKEITEFEVLLRSKATGAYPGELMDQYTATEVLNKLLLTWYSEELICHCQKHPNYVFNVNIHPQQFLHPSTWDFLKEMKDYARQINIEMTERPFFMDSNRTHPINYVSTIIRKMHSLGYKVSFDDVGSGLNSLDLVARNIDQVDCLKFSLHSFRYVDKKTIDLFLIAWHHLAESHNVKIVVEGVEDAAMSEKLYDLGIDWQQGYYWAKTVNL